MEISANVIVAPKPAAGTLLWSDEFNYEGLPDSSKWDYEVGYIRNGELQYFTKERSQNAYVTGGTLKINLLNDNYVDSTSTTQAVTSASLHTYSKMHFSRGRLEVKAKCPAGAGTWVSLFTLGVRLGLPWLFYDPATYIDWPLSGEIDLVEHVGRQNSLFKISAHTQNYYWVLNNQKTVDISSVTPNGWHVFAVEIHDDRVDYFLDDVQVFTYENERVGMASWPFDLGQYLIMNLGWGGLNGGATSNATLPQTLEIDYVRLYSL